MAARVRGGSSRLRSLWALLPAHSLRWRGGNEPVATALANCPTIALPVTAARCKFPAHVIQEPGGLRLRRMSERTNLRSSLLNIQSLLEVRHEIDSNYAFGFRGHGGPLHWPAGTRAASAVQPRFQ